MPAPVVQTYGQLHPTPISSTISVLARRIQERFPGSGLSRVAAELVTLASQNQSVVETLRQPLWWVRGLVALTIAALIEALTADLSRKIWQKISILAMANQQYPGATVSAPDTETAS